jgi:phosphoglucosamine mutase
MAKQLFGTDGIRGVAGVYPLDPVTVHAIGMALGRDAMRHEPQPEIVIGMDTRESGPWLAAQLAGGLGAAGVRSRFAGVVTTPGIAYLTRTGPFVAGVMISASHNPYQDNGIKVFGHSGFKLPDEEEHEIEQEIFRLLAASVAATASPLTASTLTEDPGLDRQYLENLAAATDVSFAGARMVLDCGHGAAYRLGPELFRRLGAHVFEICAEPNGRNINQGCGALHLEPLQQAVREQGADFGVAFDGDADRAIFVARSGKLVDGDAVLLVAARAMKASGSLAENLVVATVMSNLGLEKALEREDIRLVRTPVGDKYVLEEMVRSGAVLGGEQSGHVIFRRHATTGDGLLTALRIFEIAVKSGKGLDELTADLEIYPQRLKNVRVARKKPLDELPEVLREIRDCEAEFAGAGRVLVRFSGTEPLARVMVEGPNLAQVEDFTSRIAGAIERELG